MFTLRDGYLATPAQRFLEVLAPEAWGEDPLRRPASGSAGGRCPVPTTVNMRATEARRRRCASRRCSAGSGLRIGAHGDAPASTPVLASRRDRFKQLRAFCEAARLGSISGAAKAVAPEPAGSIAPGALARGRVRGGTVRAQRGPRIALTRVGERLYECAMPLVQGVLRLPALFAEAHHGMPLQSASHRGRAGIGRVSAPRAAQAFRRAPPLDDASRCAPAPARSGSSGCAPSSSTPSSASSMRPRPASSSTRCARPEWCS